MKIYSSYPSIQIKGLSINLGQYYYIFQAFQKILINIT